MVTSPGATRSELQDPNQLILPVHRASIEISFRRHVKNAAAGDHQCPLKKKEPGLFLV